MIKYHEKTLCRSKFLRVIRSKGEKYNLNLKAVTMKKTQYDDKQAILIANFVETTWLTRYTRPMENTYDQR